MYVFLGILKQKELSFYKEVVLASAKMSTAERKKVGAIIIRDKTIISYGYNGTPPGEDNCCEDSEGNTKDNVIHAEMNAILKAAKHGFSLDDSIMFSTLSPCINCAKHIAMTGIKEFYYLESYRDTKPLQFMISSGIKTTLT